MPYIENFALRVLFCIALTMAATLLGSFFRAQFITHAPFAFSVLNHVVIPVGLGVFVAAIWKPKQ